MPQHQSPILNALRPLAIHCSVGGPICTAAAEGLLNGIVEVRRVCSASGLAQSRTAEALSFLQALAALNFVQQISELSWRIINKTALAELAPMLQAIHLYRTEIHQDMDAVDVVLTRPPNPSVLTKTLESMMLGTWGLLDTREVLPSIAETAKERFVVMTPFLDEIGGELLIALFKQVSSSARKQLILRTMADGALPVGYVTAKAELLQIGVEVFNFRLEALAGKGSETFHAKVALADSQSAYVGSSNMNKWSFQYSLELGLLVSGQAASRIGQVIDAVTRVSIKL
jgi:hypothetical protein